MKKVTLKQGRYSISRERDGRGDAGMMLQSLDPKTGEQVGENGDIIMGCAIQCGSFFAGTYSSQDWWLTTPVTEFIEISEDKSMVKFRTGNSIYIAKSF